MNYQLHQSCARTFGDCPRKWKATKLEGLQPSYAPFTVGRACHYAAQRMIEESALGNQSSRNVALAALQEFQTDTPMTSREFSSALEIIRQMTEPGNRLRFTIPGPGRTSLVEREWGMDEQFAACPPQDAAYAGRFDLVEYGEGGVVVTDWKTNQRICTLEESDTWQGRIYALAAMALWPDVPHVLWRMQFLRFDMYHETEYRRGDPWQAETQQFMAANRRRIMAAKERDHFPATPGDGCDATCPLLFQCRELRALQDIGTLYTDMDPAAIVAGRQALKGLYDQYDRRARQLVEAEDIQYSPGKALGYLRSKRTFLGGDLVALLEDLEFLGATRDDLAKWFPRCNVNKRTLLAALTDLYERGALEEKPAERLEAYLSETTVTRLGSVRVG